MGANNKRQVRIIIIELKGIPWNGCRGIPWNACRGIPWNACRGIPWNAPTDISTYDNISIW